MRKQFFSQFFSTKREEEEEEVKKKNFIENFPMIHQWNSAILFLFSICFRDIEETFFVLLFIGTFCPFFMFVSCYNELRNSLNSSSSCCKFFFLPAKECDKWRFFLDWGRLFPAVDFLVYICSYNLNLWAFQNSHIAFAYFSSLSYFFSLIFFWCHTFFCANFF